jgi:Zn finger protein HypA/HybF involved in hydrogenase expression
VKDPVVRYKPLGQECRSCHLDVHAGQFGKTPCERCHRDESFKTQLKFEHRPPFTGFILDGQHARAKCEACHRVVPVGPNLSVTQYKPLPQTCEGCHSDFHKGAFKGFEP